MYTSYAQQASHTSTHASQILTMHPMREGHGIYYHHFQIHTDT